MKIHSGKAGKTGTAIVLAVVLIVVIRVFIFEVCIVSTDSMTPTIQSTEILVLDKLTYGCDMPRRWAEIPIVNIFTWIPPLRQRDSRNHWKIHRGWGIRKPRKGDVAVFRSPEEPNILVVKRIQDIIRPGTVLPLDSMRTTVEKMALAEHVSIIERHNKTYIGGKPSQTYTTGTTFYDMRGDNTGNSYDSRQFGPIAEEAIVGRIGLVLWSWDKQGKVRWHRMFRPVR